MHLMARATLARRPCMVESAAVATCSRAHVSAGHDLATLGRHRFCSLLSFPAPLRRYLVGHVNIGVAWLFNMVYSLALVFGSTWMVVNWAPQAAGAGVAEVMAYLNGCMLPHVSSYVFSSGPDSSSSGRGHS